MRKIIHSSNESSDKESSSDHEIPLSCRFLIRKKVRENQDHKRNKRTIEFTVGEAVTVGIPRPDRGGTDRLPETAWNCNCNKVN